MKRKEMKRKESERGKKRRTFETRSKTINPLQYLTYFSVFFFFKKPKRKPNLTTFIHIRTIYLYSYILIYAYKTPKIMGVGREEGRG